MRDIQCLEFGCISERIGERFVEIVLSQINLCDTWTITDHWKRSGKHIVGQVYFVQILQFRQTRIQNFPREFIAIRVEICQILQCTNRFDGKSTTERISVNLKVLQTYG